MLKVDLHTHSDASPDGGVSLKGYRQALETSQLNAIAITDHNQIENALKIKAELGDAIIVGEEIMTREGEIVGLFLSKRVKPGLSAQKAAEAIKAQGGLVYIPHPFEMVRKGLNGVALEKIIDLVDIIEAYNGRALIQTKSRLAIQWARAKSKSLAASSDAHNDSGLGTTYSLIESKPAVGNLVAQLGQARFAVARPGIRSVLAPKANRLKKKIKKRLDA